MNLKKKELKDLFNASIDNSQHLFDAGQELALKYQKKKFPSLGLAELALEELGKSYTCLAYYSKADKISDWKPFWKEWKAHDLKAHRGFFYEFFCLLRVEVDDDLYKILPSPIGKFSKEKELSFYVDIDKSNRQIHIPANEIEDKECIFRLMSLIGLLSSAMYVKDWMNSQKPESFKDAISDYAYLTITTQIYQQDVERVLEGMKTNDTDYNAGLEAVWTLFNPDKYDKQTTGANSG